MLPNIISFLATASAIIIMANPTPVQNNDILLSQREISLNNRQRDPWVNDVFKDNILLNVSYIFGKVESKPVVWEKIKKPFKYEMELKPHEVFAFHEDVLPRYQGKISRTTNAHFNSEEGFKSDGYLFGDGVCHLASLISWVAKDAKLEVEAPVNHDFRDIPDIPKEFGVSIYNVAGESTSNAFQNLYITNNRKKPIKFEFTYNGETLRISVFETNL